MRLALDGIAAVEVWDVVVRGRLLQAWRDHPAFAERLADAVVAIAAEPPAAWSPRARSLAIGAVHLVGGASDATACAAIASRGIACTWSRDELAAARAASRGGMLGVDIGQTGIKLALGERTWRVERDRTRAPHRDGVALADRARARATTIAFLAEAIADHAPRAVVGLPCELRDDGVPRSCTYCWRDPDPDLVAELAAASHTELAIANDAELAALAARESLAPIAAPVLVLTLGFGVGGAILY